MTKNRIDIVQKRRFNSMGQLRNEYHFFYRYGPNKELGVYLGAVLFPNNVPTEKKLNEITRSLAEVWGLIPPKQNRK